MTTSRLTSPGDANVGKTTHANANASSISTRAIEIPKKIAAEFVRLAPILGNNVTKRNRPTYRKLLALCSGESLSKIPNTVKDAAEVLCSEGAEKTLRLLQGSKAIGRPPKFDNFRGYDPSSEQHAEFASLVKTYYAQIAPFRRPLVDAIVQLGQGVPMKQLRYSAGLADFSIVVHARRLDFYTPRGAFYYFTLPERITFGQRKKMDLFHEERKAQGNLPKVPTRVTRKFDVPKQAPQVHQANSTERPVDTEEFAASTAAENAPPKTVSLEQVLLPSLPPPASSNSGSNTGASMKGQVAPFSRGAAPSKPGLPPPMEHVEMLEDSYSAFLDGIMHTHEK